MHPRLSLQLHLLSETLLFQVSERLVDLWSQFFVRSYLERSVSSKAPRSLLVWNQGGVFVHFLHVTSFEGKRCIDTPGVWLELVQLSNPGPPATQYFPDTQRFRTSAISLNNLHNWWRHKEFFGLKCWTLSFGKNIL